jgi:protein tyrosine/serine phosphatase
MSDSIEHLYGYRAGQPHLRMKHLPVLNHCFKKKDVLEMDYLGQQ